MSEIKVNKVSPRTNCGTVQLGDSGDTITIPAGATITNNGTQTGFGRTGTVNWQTTPKTGDFTAVNGEGYFVNTTSGTVTMTMPSGSAGSIVSIQDYNKTFDNNNFTVTPASGQKINGGVADGILIISTEGQGLTFVYVDSTVGWKTVHENEFTAGGSSNIIATGGTVTTCGNCKIHTFTGPGTFTVTQVDGCAANNVVSYAVIAGGGGGGGGGGGSGGGSGGGAGGFRELKSPTTPYTASPLDGYPSAPNRVTITATAFPIEVGGGSAGGGDSTPTGNASSGSNSSFSTIIAAGGGGGRYGPCYSQDGVAGGSGSGASGGTPGSRTGGSGNTPSVTPAQGNNGGSTGPFPQPPATIYHSAGGGGAGGVGQNSQPGPRAGGPGVATHITGSPVTYAAGGNGGTYAGGGTPISNAPDNSGNGGAGKSTGPGGSPSSPGANGGSGIVVIRYKFQ
mgnify:CR=1 FL=1